MDASGDFDDTIDYRLHQHHASHMRYPPGGVECSRGSNRVNGSYESHFTCRPVVVAIKVGKVRVFLNLGKHAETKKREQ